MRGRPTPFGTLRLVGRRVAAVDYDDALPVENLDFPRGRRGARAGAAPREELRATGGGPAPGRRPGHAQAARPDAYQVPAGGPIRGAAD